MNTIESPMHHRLENPDVGPAANITLFIGFCCLMYFMYDHFDKRFMNLKDRFIENEARFHVVEDKLATLDEIEEDVRQLNEAETERKSSWEDDITEPGKYQAILGKGKVGELDVEIRIYNESLNTFKSNRYWILNNTISPSFIRYLYDTKVIGGVTNFKAEGDKIIGIKKILTGVDSIMCIECSLTNKWSPPFEVEGTKRDITQTLYSIDLPKAIWKRGLIDSHGES